MIDNLGGETEGKREGGGINNDIYIYLFYARFLYLNKQTNKGQKK